MNKTESLILLYLKGNGWVSFSDLTSWVYDDIGNNDSHADIQYHVMDLFYQGLISSKVQGRSRSFKEVT